MLLACVGVVDPARVVAQPSELREAESALENAEFERAAEILEELADSERGLDRADVSELLRLRAVVRSALGREREADRDLLALAQVSEGREPGALPDAMMRRYDRYRQRVPGPIRASVLIRPAADRVEVELEIEDDPTELVRRREMVCRAGSRVVASTDALELTVRNESELRCDARVFGPGGWLAAEASTSWRSSNGGASTPGGEPDWLEQNWTYLLAAGGGLVALIVLIAVVAYVAAPTGVSGPIWVPPEP